MKQGIQDYVRYRMERSRDSLEAAKASTERGLYNDAVNRIYYACFYAVSALLISKGLSSSKHSGVRSLFEQHFVKDGPLPRALGKFYHQLFDSRQEGDYTDFVRFEKEDVSELSAQADRFIASISEQLDNENGEDS